MRILFDGDEMNVVLLADNWMAEKAENFAPHKNVVDVDYYKISGNIFLPPTLVASISNYMVRQEQEDKKCPIYNKLLNITKENK